LHAGHFSALYAISRLLRQTHDLPRCLDEILHVLADDAGLIHGMVAFVERGSLVIRAMHDPATDGIGRVHYRAGEGVLGMLLEKPHTLVLPRVGDESRFLHRLGICEQHLPFVAAPILVGSEVRGILAAQPAAVESRLLAECGRFLELVAQQIGQAIGQAGVPAPSGFQPADWQAQSPAQHRFDDMVGRSAAMGQVFERARLVARWNTSVLIRGETGTGKELIANAIHNNSPRADNALVKLNCATLPENLLETELFGHERGAFTGAVEARKGRFEQAHGGTLFLDEIGEVSPAFQAKLLRVLQEGEFERVGGSRTIKVDVRIIAATHRNLETAVDTGDFREDLFYRLNVMPIFLPPLRERIEDIPDIVHLLLGKIGKAQQRPLVISEGALLRLTRHHWPGNVRELENCLERAAVLSPDGQIDFSLIHFPDLRERSIAAPFAARPARLDDPTLSRRERIVAALEQAGWVKAKAARLLNMTTRQIDYRIQTLNIEIKRF
jgi:Nif-specific regulatory protein